MSTEREQRIATLKDILQERIVCLDGAMGTAIQARRLGPRDFGGEAYEGCNELLAITRPDVLADIHRGHLAAGADIVETCSFGSTGPVLAEYGLQARAFEITKAAATVARQAADAFATRESPRFVAGSMGPTTKSITVAGGVTFDDLTEAYREQARALIEGGVDYLLLETCLDTRNIKAGIAGILDACEEIGVNVPIAVSGTIEPTGTMLAGQSAESLVVSLAHLDLLYIGLNCATGPEPMTDHLRAMAELARTRVACVPNAGLPDENGTYLETPEMFARTVARFVDEGWVNVIGGCCGTTNEHIQALVRTIQGKRPRTIPRYTRSLISGLETVEIADDNRPVLVGERTNSLGSRVFKQLIADGKYEEASEIARRQVHNGAQVIDVCLQNPDRNELEDTERFLEYAIHKVKVPLMIDTTDHRVLARALTYSQGKAVINSINLEDGLERFDRVVPLAKRFGAALVVGCIDDNKEQGMAVTRERKLAIARRSLDILTTTYGVSPEDILFDALVFPCATGDKSYLGSAAETVEGVRLIKEAFPTSRTILGVSNVSFGLPPAGREIVNSVFLYHATKAGLDMAIVNSEKLERYATIPEDERRLAEEVLFHTSDEVITAFSARYRDQKSRVVKATKSLSLDARLADYIVSGSKDGLIEDLTKKMAEAAPLSIINGPLMAGMEEVGRLFNKNELIVAEVLQSAEAMKAAVSYLEQFMERAESSHRGKVVLATVKGDVHDIGKNLVEIILSNNGYKVVNLGIKVPPQDLITAIAKEDPDIVGLSGLLVKSALQMVVTAEEMSRAGRCPPLLVGGAALTKNFTLKRIAPAYDGIVAYAKDAMDGLDLCNRLISPEGREELRTRLRHEQGALLEKAKEIAVAATEDHQGVVKRVPPVDDLPTPPDYDRHVLKHIPLDEIWSYINPKMLYGKHLGLKGDINVLLARGDTQARELTMHVDEVKAKVRPGGAMPMAARAVWQFFPASGKDNAVRLFAPDEPTRTLCELDFPRQAGGDRLCLADYVRPADTALSPRDGVCLFVVTAGEGIRAYYEELKARGRYLESHAIQALAIETAEALAEWLHKKLRSQWGFPDPPGVTMKDLFQARYRGKRYSFGYPACPDLAMQTKLFDLLKPEDIGVSLTEELMMDPEASVSALVLHHPLAQYFSVGKEYL
jgi:5-methyltetrahydrofolate--homocysteine methyltransferase